jgi:hypothetical protein
LPIPSWCSRATAPSAFQAPPTLIERQAAAGRGAWAQAGRAVGARRPGRCRRRRAAQPRGRRAKRASYF